MVKLPDYKTRPRAPAAGSTQTPTMSTELATRNIRSAREAIGKVTELAGTVYEGETKKRDDEEALIADLEFQKKERQIQKSFEEDTNYEAHAPQYEIMSKAAIDSTLEKVTNPEVRRQLQARFENKRMASLNQVDRSARRGIEDKRQARLGDAINGALAEVGSESTPVESLPARIAEQVSNIDAMVSNGTLSAVQGRRFKEEFVNSAAKTYAKRLALQSPETALSTIQEYMKARNAGKFSVNISGQPADKGARAKMADLMFKSEARTDGRGKVQIYQLPAGDGGGSYEVAGINEKYHPEMAAKLAGMIRRGNHAEAERQAKAYFQSITAKAGDVVAHKGAGVEYVMRDIALNRGHGGALATLRLALGNDKVSPSNQREAYAPLSAAEKQQLAAMPPAVLIRELSRAREEYEDRFAGARPQFRKGLENRWSRVEKEAMGLGADPASEEIGEGNIDPAMRTTHAVFGSLSDVELRDLENSIKTERRVKDLEKYADDTETLKGAIDRIRNGGTLTPENKEEIKQIGARWKSLGPQYEQRFNVMTNQIEESQHFAKALNGSDTIKKDVGLDGMTAEEMNDHFDALQERAKKGSLRDQAIQGRAIRDAIKRGRDVLEKRAKDPAAAVLEIPAVKEADKDLDQLEGRIVQAEGAFDEARLRLLRRQQIEARLLAQDEVRVVTPRAITKQEAQNIYPFVKSAGTDEEFEQKIETYYRQALERYGDNNVAAKVVRDAYELQVKGPKTERKETFGYMIERMADTQFSRKDIRQLERVTRDAERYNPDGTRRDIGPPPMPTEAEQKLLRERAGDPNVVEQFRRDYGDQVTLDILYGKKIEPKAEVKKEAESGTGTSSPLGWIAKQWGF